MKLSKILAFLAFPLMFSAISHGYEYESNPDKAVLAHFRLSVPIGHQLQTSTNVIVIDLSSAGVTNEGFPHEFSNGYIEIYSIELDIDKVAASSASVRIGVVTFVNASTGAVSWFWAKEHPTNVNNTNLHGCFNYWPYSLKTKVVPNHGDGLTPFLITSTKTLESVDYQTDVELVSPAGAESGPPGKGDIVMEVENGSGVTLVDLRILYGIKRD